MAARPGVFIARVLDAKAGKTNEKHVITAVYELLQEQVPEGFVDVTGERMTITNVYWLEKKDGSLNDFAIENLQEVFGIGGSDPWTWAENMLDKEARLTLEDDTYDGKTRLRVRWTNHRDSTGTIKLDSGDAARRDFANRFGSKLRARMGGTAITPPAKAAAPAAPAPPVAPPKPAPAPPASPAEDPEEPAKIIAACWGRYEAATPDKADDARAADFWRIVSAATRGKTDGFTLAEAQAAAQAVAADLDEEGLI